MVPVKNPRSEIGVTDSTTDAPFRGEKPVVIGAFAEGLFPAAALCEAQSGRRARRRGPFGATIPAAFLAKPNFFGIVC